MWVGSLQLILIFSKQSLSGLLWASLLLLCAMYALHVMRGEQIGGFYRRVQPVSFAWYARFSLRGMLKFWRERRELKQNSTLDPAHQIAEQYQWRTEQGRIRLTKYGVCFVFGMLIGTFGTLGFVQGRSSRETRELRERWTYHDVLITDRYSANHYQLRPAGMDKYDTKLCTPTDWERGQMMRDLYMPPSDDGTCKDIANRGYFSMYTDSKGNRINFEQEITDALSILPTNYGR